MGASRVAETAEALRGRMETGSLNLLGVAAALRRLVEDLENDQDAAAILSLLERQVDAEAEAMGKAEAFLLHWAWLLSPLEKGKTCREILSDLEARHEA